MLLFLLHSLGDPISSITDTYDSSISYLLADKGSQEFFFVIQRKHVHKTMKVHSLHLHSLSKLIPRR